MGPIVYALCAPPVLVVSSADVIPQLRMGPLVPFLVSWFVNSVQWGHGAIAAVYFDEKNPPTTLVYILLCNNIWILIGVEFWYL